MSRVCEEFHCLPLAAIREIERDPDRLAEMIIVFRDYARAKDVVDHAKKANDIPDVPMTDLVVRHQIEIIKERMRQRRDAAGTETQYGD